MSYRAGFVGLIGQPNAGKSTLLNMLVKEKVSIVTDKPQTTRRRVMGVVSQKEGQIVFVDAPGVLNAKEGLNSFLEKEALDVIDKSDVLIAVLSIDEKDPEQIEKIIKLVSQSKKPWVAVFTKTDIVSKKHRIKLIKEIIEKHSNKTIYSLEMSNQWGKDAEAFLKDLKLNLIGLLPESPQPLYDIELFTPHNTRDLCAEIIREKSFEELRSELPYSIAIRINKFDESDKKITRIYADILVSKDSHKVIVVGKEGKVIKKIGMAARKEIEKLINSKVFLGLEVVVREDWFKNKRIMKELGYVINENE